MFLLTAIAEPNNKSGLSRPLWDVLESALNARMQLAYSYSR